MRWQGPTRDRLETFENGNDHDNILFETKTACLSNYRHRTDVTDLYIII